MAETYLTLYETVLRKLTTAEVDQNFKNLRTTADSKAPSASPKFTGIALFGAIGDNGSGALVQIAGGLTTGGKLTAAPSAPSAFFDYDTTASMGRIMVSDGAGGWNRNLQINPYGGNVLVGSTIDSGTGAKIQVAGGGTNYGNFESSDAGKVNRWCFGRDNALTGNFVFALNESTKVSIDSVGSIKTTGNLKCNLANSQNLSGTYDYQVIVMSNTQIMFQMRGSDGVTRSYTMPLS